MGKGLPALRMLHSADGWTPEFERHFKHFYEGILAQAITDPDMRESRQRLRRLSDPRGFGRGEPWGFLSLALAPQGRGWRTAGGVCYEWYRGGRGALVTYIAVAPQMRRRGLGQHLLASAFAQLRKASHLQPGASLPVFAETETLDPDAPAHERREALARFAALARLGFKALDFPYIQPPLSAGKAHVDHLTLMAYAPAADADAFEAARIEQFLKVFYRALIGAGLDNDAPCQRTLFHLQKVKSVALKPLTLHNSPGRSVGDGHDERRGTLA